mgnify:CR=1 FL=1
MDNERHSEAYDLETVARFDTLTSALFHRGPLSFGVRRHAIFAVINAEYAIRYPFTKNRGAYLDPELAEPESYEAL